MPLPTRRKFLRRALAVGAAGLAGGTLAAGYGFWEASQIRLRRGVVAVPRLPASFVGKTVCVLADFHHGPFVSIGFIRDAVALAQSLRPDLFALIGDFAHKGTHAAEQLPPCLEAVSPLSAPLGVFAVPGNHDMPNRGQLYRDCVATTPLTDLTNRGVRVSLGGDHLWLAGVDDLWWGRPDLAAALKGVPDSAAAVLLSHNPDFAEDIRDERVGLVLSGHTHGGQAYVPGLGPLWMPSKFDEKYRGGPAQGPACGVYVSRGLGEAGVPLRLNCPPEIVLLTLTGAEPGT